MRLTLMAHVVPLFATALAMAAPAAHAQQVVRLPAQDRALGFRSQTVFQIGKEEGRSWEVLSGVRQVAFDRAENLYVLDSGNARVLVFDRTGRFVRQVGKKGSGPGEFTSPERLAITGDGSLVVADLARQAFSVFSPDGRFKHTVPYDASYGISGVGLAAHPRGGVVTGTQPLPIPGRPARGNAVVWYPLTENAKSSRLFEVAAPASAPSRPVGGGGSGTMIMSTGRPVFSPVLRWDVLPGGGIVTVSTSEYAVQVRNPNGTLARVLQRPIKPRAVTRRDREAELERRAERAASGGGTVAIGVNGQTISPAVQQAAVARHAATAEFATVMPVVQDLAVDRSGRIWVQRSSAVAGQPGPVDLLSGDGRYLGTLAAQPVPDAFSPSGRAAYIVKDDLGVERVVVRALPPLRQ
jgi:hypothetical protein